MSLTSLISLNVPFLCRSSSGMNRTIYRGERRQRILSLACASIPDNTNIDCSYACPSSPDEKIVGAEPSPVGFKPLFVSLSLSMISCWRLLRLSSPLTYIGPHVFRGLTCAFRSLLSNFQILLSLLPISLWLVHHVRGTQFIIHWCWQI